MRVKILFSFFFSLFLINSFAQKEASNWYFGNLAALSFSTQPPTILTNNAMISGVCGSSISDASGNLLFYTNGTQVYNKQHIVMANGASLAGVVEDQSGLAVRQPGNPNLYYLFSLAGTWSTVACYYSIVDLSLAAGLGSVSVLNNTLMLTPGSEKITAVRHCNGVDVWIILHEFNSSNFRAYLLTSSGISVIPVISSAGSVFLGPTCSGVIKASPNGKQLVTNIFVTYSSSYHELYDFNNATGVVSNPLNLGQIALNESLEFSPDGTKLYASAGSSYIVQWDLCAGNGSAIVASRDTVGIRSATNITLGYMQRAPDGKIYVSRFMGSAGGTSDLGVINNPNAFGSACNYVDVGQSLGTGTCNRLPGFINDLVKMPLPYIQQSSCPTVSFTFPSTANSCAVSGNSLVSFSWHFGDPSSGTLNTSTNSNPVHIFSSTGNYKVKLELNYGACSPDTLTETINVIAPPSLTITGKQTICSKESTTLIANGANSYNWSTGASGASLALTPSVSGVYTVTGTFTNSSCSSVKTITLNVLKCLNLGENNSFTKLSVYPNPCFNHLFVESESHAAIKFYDQFGRLILSIEINSGTNKIDLKELNSGFYLIKIIASDRMDVTHLIKMD